MKAAIKHFLESVFNQKIRKYSYQRRIRALFKEYGIRDVIDVGANSGQFVEWVHKAFISKKTVVNSFEPLESAFIALKENTKRYKGRFNWHVYNFALSDSKRQQEINVSVGDATSSSLHDIVEKSPVQIIGKQTVSLEVFDTLELPYIDKSKVLIKIDVQGHEMHVLNGMDEYIESNRPFVLKEIANISSYKSERSLLDYLDYFKARNYKLLWIEHNITELLMDREWDLCFAPSEKV